MVPWAFSFCPHPSLQAGKENAGLEGRPPTPLCSPLISPATNQAVAAQVLQPPAHMSSLARLLLADVVDCLKPQVNGFLCISQNKC